MDDTQLAELKEATGIEDFSNLTEEQTAKIFEKISRNELSQKKIAAIIELAPTFVGAFVETTKSITQASSDLCLSHRHALEALKSIEALVDPLSVLAMKCETPEAQIALAGTIKEISFKVCETVSDIQRENNRIIENLSKKLGILGVALLAACVVGAIAIGAYAASKGER